MRAGVACLVLGCACSTVGSSALRTAPSAPATQGPIAVRFTQDPVDADELGIVESYGLRPTADLQQVMAELTGRAAALGGDIVRVDAFATRFELFSETYTYDCATTMTTTDSMTVFQPQTCIGFQEVEGVILTIRGRAFRSRKGVR
jgi:hypothetical protein